MDSRRRRCGQPCPGHRPCDPCHLLRLAPAAGHQRSRGGGPRQHRALHSRPAVYTDPRIIPFTASYFNWLFYALYGVATGETLRLFGLTDAWLPTLGRLITLAFAVTGVATFARLLRHATQMGWSAALVIGVLAFFNPLCGFWIVTTRPDLAAAVLELMAVSAYLRGRNVLGVALLLACAWAFKQTSLGALAGIVLALKSPSVRLHCSGTVSDWTARILCGFVAVSALVSLCALGPIYRHGLYLSQIHSGFHVSWAARHFATALIKMPFIAVALIVAAWGWPRSDRMLRTVTLILGATFVFEFVASCKGGAGDYYFLSLGVWSTLWLGLALEQFNLKVPLACATLLQAAAVLAVFLGHCGAIDPRESAPSYQQLAEYLAAQPGPVFVQDTYGDLPWLSPTSPHFVIAYNNQVDAAAGVKFEHGGWQGLIAEGYFATVVTKMESGGLGGAMLTDYRYVRSEAGWRFYERK